MPGLRNKRHEEVKKAMMQAEGSLQVAALILDMKYQSLSRLLCSTLRPWWSAYKVKLQKERAKARQARYERRKVQAAQDQTNEYRAHQGLPPIYPYIDPEDYV